MVRNLRGVVSRIGVGVAAGALLLSVVAAGGVAGAATKAVPGGNASGGSLAVTAAKQKLIGAKGTGLTRGITSTSISVGCVYTSADYEGYIGGIEAAFHVANEKGIDGRKLNLVPCKDDTGGVQSDVSEVEQLVQQNQVFSVMSLTEYILSGSTNFLNANQVPYYGWGFNPGFCGYRWGFGWNGCLSPVLLPTSDPLHNVDQGNLAQAIIKTSGLAAKNVRFAVQAENSPSGTSGNADYDTLFKALGAKVVYSEANFPLTATGVDYTPYVQAIMAAKPNITFISTPFADVGGMASALKAAGYKGITMDFVTYSPGLLASSAQLASALQGEYINTQVVPQEEASSPYVKQELAALKASGQQPFLTLGASIGYAEATEFIEQLQAVGKNLNTKTFDQVVNGGKFTSFTTVGADGPGKLLWPAAHYLPADCAVIVKVSGTAYTVENPFKCYTSYLIKS
jgi:ABC-type branched-subunit amino acid transport system substrate-binding protein